LISGSSV